MAIQAKIKANEILMTKKTNENCVHVIISAHDIHSNCNNFILRRKYILMSLDLEF